MIKISNTLKVITLGVIIGSVLAGSCFATYYILVDNSNPKEKDKNNSNPSTLKEKDKYEYTSHTKYIFSDGGASMGEVIEDNDRNGPYISEVNITDQENLYWLGPEGLEKLKEKIIKKLTYGPEIFLLKSISIGDENFINEDNNGSYIPFTNEIFINTKNLIKEYFPTNSENDTEALTDAKVELVYQIIFHEYYHHIANSYLNNEPLGTTASSSDIYSDKTNDDNLELSRVATPWNKDFLDTFKKNLYYDRNKDISNNNFDKLEEPIRWNDKVYKSLGSIYNSKNIFDIANGRRTPNFSKLGHHPGFDGYVSAVGEPSFLIPVTNKSLIYTNSMSELFVRKYQQLIEPYYYNKYFPNIGIPGVVRTEGKKLLTSELLYNRSSYESLSERKHIYPFSHEVIVQRYLDDGPFEPNGEKNERSIKLYENLDKHFGHSSGDDISFIWSKNDSKLLNTDQIYISVDDMNEKIKFGGYINEAESKKYKYIGYWNNGGVFISIPIDIHDFTYKSKETLTATEYEPLNIEMENKFYILDNWVIVDDIQNKTLFFSQTRNGKLANGENATSPLKSVRNSDETGYATTWSPSSIDYKLYTNDKYKTYAGIQQNDSSIEGGVKIMIGEKTW
ncbi:MYPU_1760 family metalloprotease [Candidatus Mycoplasma mahonii]|uniref:MYPU_1760 family metalloprotease n=1 Tax=Candidatus Mycoplasma mahonii TaxID=3004105 RepID=UPI0026EA3D5F|nr:hypothetical protein [Candidatus Mycoplasma mahonii]WKX02579.1 hypothetical protein O3I44_00675 [Candidatus Mycoplasma mahonii]